MKLTSRLIYYLIIFFVGFGSMTYMKIHRGGAGRDGPNMFAISGTLANGDTISGSVQITTRYYGTFYGGPVFISGPQSFTLNDVLAGYQLNTKTYVGEATVTEADCPTLYFGVQSTGLHDYAGGPLGPNSGLKLCDGTYIPLVSGALLSK
jgi:hypothetical protein